MIGRGPSPSSRPVLDVRRGTAERWGDVQCGSRLAPSGLPAVADRGGRGGHRDHDVIVEAPEGTTSAEPVAGSPGRCSRAGAAALRRAASATAAVRAARTSRAAAGASRPVGSARASSGGAGATAAGATAARSAAWDAGAAAGRAASAGVTPTVGTRTGRSRGGPGRRFRAVRSGEGQDDGEGRPLPPSRVQVDVAAVRRGEGGGDGEAETAAAAVPAAGLLDAVEPVEDAGDVRGRDSGAVVVHGDDGELRLRLLPRSGLPGLPALPGAPL